MDFVADGLNGSVFNSYLVEIVASANSRFDVLMDKDVIAVVGKDLPKDKTDRLHSLTRLPANADRHVKTHNVLLQRDLSRLDPGIDLILHQYVSYPRLGVKQQPQLLQHHQRMKLAIRPGYRS